MEFASERFVSLAGVQTEFQMVQFRLAHDAGESKQQPVVIGARVVDAFRIGDERLEQTTQLEQAVPIAVVAR